MQCSVVCMCVCVLCASAVCDVCRESESDGEDVSDLSGMSYVRVRAPVVGVRVLIVNECTCRCVSCVCVYVCSVYV